jgi:hypothetical protein
MSLPVIIIILSLILLNLVQGIIHANDRRKSNIIHNDLLNRLMARDLLEYERVTKELRTSSKDKVKEMEVENELALKAAEIENKTSGIRIGA